MKSSEIHEMSDDQLFSKGAELREQLFRLRFKQQLGNTDVVRQIQVARRDLARIKTEVRSREVRAAVEEGTRTPRVGTRAERKRRTAVRQRAQARA